VDKELKYLIDILKEANLNREADELTHLLIKSANIVGGDLEAWKAVLNEIERPHETQVQTKAIVYLVEAAKNLKDAAALKEADPEDIKDSAEKLRVVMSNMNMTSEDFFVKEAGAMALLGKAAPLFSFLIAIKNVYYGFQEFKKVQGKSGDVGLNWMDTLQPAKMMSKAKEYSESPVELKTVVELTKSGSLLWDEGISFVVNLLDGFKDILLLMPTVLGYFAGLGIGGLTVSAIDFGISMLLWLAVEAPAEKFMKTLYLPNLEFITGTAQMAIASLIEQQAPTPDDSEELPLADEDENFDAEAWWASIA
jgi:hypothetical protein